MVAYDTMTSKEEGTLIEASDQSVYLQFGKVAKNSYRMSVAYPCSIL
jgi:hypothetical protein